MTCIKKGYLETTHGQVHYRAAGERGAPSLLLLHQTASSSAMYEELMERLANQFCLFAPDTPGFGGTFFPPQRATMEFYAEVLYEAALSFGFDSYFVFGHHTGASIAVQIEFDHPGFAQKMILSGPPYLTTEQREGLRASIAPIVLQEDGSHLLKLWTRLRAKDTTVPIELTHREFLLNLHAGERYHEAYLAVCDHDFNAQLAALNCPVLVMAGDNDTLLSALEPAYDALKHGRMRRIPDANTYICDRWPEVVAEIVREFFVL
jgi:pimeloyl-ACP methyl ester carboxylesterase